MWVDGAASEYVGPCGRYGEVIMEDLAKMSLSDPSNPEELKLGKVAPVTFESVARKEHKWQVTLVPKLCTSPLAHRAFINGPAYSSCRCFLRAM
jgi:hypothetical protein